MATNSYVPFYPSDWLAGTRGLSAAETGIYITLIAMMYERGEPLNFDNRRLARLCGTTSTNFNRAMEVLIDEGKITQTDEGYWNEKVSKVLSRVSEKRTAATQSANARWAKKSNENNDSDDANASETQCEMDANQRPKAKDIVIVRFDEFWEVYPHRDGVKRNRKGSKQKYDRAVKSGVPEQELIDAARRYQGDKRVSEGYARDPCTWLNQEGWTDETASPANPDRSEKLNRWRKAAGGNQ